MRKTRSASAAVMMMWLVTVKKYGNMPKRLATRMNMKSEKTSGKNFIASVPAVVRTMLATNS